MRYNWKISGRVQGVFYRRSFQIEASKLGVVGTVKNCSDGTVEAWVEAEEEELAKLMEWARKGPQMAKVEEVSVLLSEQIETPSFFSFEVIASD